MALSQQKPEPVSILKSSPNSRSIPSEGMSVSMGRTARIVTSESEEDDCPQDNNLNNGMSDADDEEAMPTSALELLKTEKAIKSGYLLKKGEKRRTWKKRWFVLRTTKLAMYKDSKEYKLLRIIDLYEIHSVVHVSTNSKYKYMFAISTPKRMYYVQADNQEDMVSWIEAIERTKTEHLLYDADDDASSVSRDQAYARNVINSYQAHHAAREQQRRISAHRGVHDGTSILSSRRLSGDVGASSDRRSSGHARVPPLDIPKANGKQHTEPPPRSGDNQGLSPYSTGYTYPLSPDSDQQAQIHMAEGLASSEDDEEEYEWNETLASVQEEENRNRVLIDGYLLKLGRNKGWRKRWFVLRTDTLAYYEDDREYKPRRIIPLVNIIDSLEIKPMSKNKKYCFKIVIPKRSYVLCASSEEKMESWLNALSVAVRRAKRQEANDNSSSSVSQRVSVAAQQQQQPGTTPLKKLASGSSIDSSFENTSHISDVSGAGAIGGAGGALPGPAHSHLHRLGRAK